MDALGHLRHMIAALDSALVEALCHRARYPFNAEAYSRRDPVPGDIPSLARDFAEAGTLAGRVRLLRPAYLQLVLPPLCLPGEETTSSGGLAADHACLDALARRLTLSVHVASRKRESLPPALQAAIRTGDPASVEAAITHPDVEEDVRRRVRTQAAGLALRPEIPDRLAALYAEWIIPLSRRIQVHGLLTTLPGPNGSSNGPAGL